MQFFSGMMRMILCCFQITYATIQNIIQLICLIRSQQSLFLTFKMMSDRPKPSEIPVLASPRPIIPTITSHTSIRSEPPTQSDSLLKHYYNSYLRLCKEGTVLINQINIITSETKQLKDKLEVLKVEQEEKRKRHRRPANEIKRNFNCLVSQCGKSYGSEASVHQHIKLKHQSFFQSEAYEQILLSKHKKKDKLINYQLPIVPSPLPAFKS